MLTAIGMTPQEVIDAGTASPAEVWGLDVGTLALGRPATFMVLAVDPLDDVTAIAEPAAVWVDGVPL